MEEESESSPESSWLSCALSLLPSRREICWLADLPCGERGESRSSRFAAYAPAPAVAPATAKSLTLSRRRVRGFGETEDSDSES